MPETEQKETQQVQKPTPPSSPQFLYDGTGTHKKRTAGQKILIFVAIIGVLAFTFVLTAINSRRIQQERERATESSSAQPSNPSQLKKELIEAAARKKKDSEVPPSILVEVEPKAPAPVQVPVQAPPQIIVLQPQPAVQQYRNVARVTDAQKEDGRKYRELRTTSLASKSSVEGFGKSTASSTSGVGNASDPYGSSGLDNVTVSQIQEILAAATASQGTKDAQASKLDFLTKSGATRTPQNYSENVRTPQLAKLELKAGTVIPGLLITGINSDLPGTVIGQVSENVYDTATGHWLLIPQGARLIGAYDSNISYGQKRVGIVWNRLIYPDGSSLNIAGSPGTDMAGFSGIKGKVDNHYGKLLSAAIFTSLFTAAVDIVNDDDSDSDSDKKSARDILIETTATTIANIGARMADKALDIQPTIVIKPGCRFNVMVQQDIIFPSPWLEPKTQVGGF